MNIAKGYLSYTLATLAILGAVAGYILGITDTEQAIAIVWAGLALIGIRRAIPTQATTQE